MLFAPVHNEAVTKGLTDAGLKLLEGGNPLDLIAEAKGGYLLFGAHGHPACYEEKARQEGIEYADLTCPYVKSILDSLKEETREHDVIYLGEQGHQECVAALSISKRIFLFKEGTTNKLPITDLTPIFRCQTTMSLEEIAAAFEEIAGAFPGAINRARPCPATAARQALAGRIPPGAGSAVVLGSKTSRNTLSLYEAIRKKNPGLFVVRALDAGELRLSGDLLRGKAPCYLLSGASSADSSIEEAYEYLSSL